MHVDFDRQFRKKYKKLDRKIRQRFDERVDLFVVDPLNAVLNNHSVNRAYPGLRSINITGDYRALFTQIRDDKVVFMNIGTHSELY